MPGHKRSKSRHCPACWTVYRNAEILADLAVAETGMGVYEDKVSKCRNKANLVWNNLKGKKSVGVIERDDNKKIFYVAKPMGIICAVTPSTNPVVTAMSNAMFALKGRNAIIIAPHPHAKKTTTRTVELLNEAISSIGAPKNLIQIIKDPTIELTNELMKSSDVVVATGGMNMVKAAYSSGKPSYGVGSGNVQVIFDRNIDFEKAVKDVIGGRSFDNGIICSGDQCIICHIDDFDEITKLLQQNGCYFVADSSEAKKIRETIFIDGVINRDIVGKSTMTISMLAKVGIPETAKVIALKEQGEKDPLRKEKMCPVLLICRYKDFNDAIAIARKNLEIEGAGHSCVIHSNNISNIEVAGNMLPVSRLVVNQPGITAGGSFYNSLNPTNTLGCGSWGNNSISENLTYKHLINIQQIAFKKDNVHIPSEQEIWS